MTGGKTWSWNGTTWNIFATANLVSSGNIVPSQNNTFDLGTSSQRWRDLYLSGNTLIIGGATISATGSNLVLPQGTTIIGTGLLGATGPIGASGATGPQGASGPAGGFDAVQTLNSQSSSYTLTLADRGKLVQMTNAGNVNLTIPDNASAAFPIGTHIDFVNEGGGNINVISYNGVTINVRGGVTYLNDQYAAATLVKTNTDTWLLVGTAASSGGSGGGTTTTTTSTTTAAPGTTTTTTAAPSGVIGQTAYTTAGTYSWVCPTGVTSVCVVAVGGGGNGASSGSSGSGGGLGWKNNISVTPGQSYTVVVGGSSGDSYFINTSTVKGGGGGGNGGAAGTYTGDGGGNGGAGAAGSGGAGGYTGAGGAGVSGYNGTAGNGSGGGGGGGEFYRHIQNGWYEAGAGGGGVGLLGQGSDGAGATSSSVGGGGGSSGTGGSNCEAADQGGAGGAYGGGGGKGGWLCNRDYSTCGRSGAGGAVRIIWGTGRSFPSTNTGNL